MLLLGTVCRTALSFAFVVYIAALLEVEGFGKYSLVIHYFELFLGLSATAIGIHVTREAAKRPRRLSELLGYAAVLAAALSVVAGGLLAALCWAFGYAPDTRLAMNIASLALLPGSLAIVLEAAFISLERAQNVTYGTVLESILRISLSFAALWLGFGLLSLFWILLIARCVLAVFYWLRLRRYLVAGRQFRRRRFWIFLRQWRVFAAENWLAAVYMSLDVIILSAFLGEAAVGLYTAAAKVVRLGSLAAKSYTTAVFPVLTRLYGASRPQFEQLSRYTLRFILAIMLPATAAVTVHADFVIGMLYSSEYAEAIPVLRVLVWGLLLDSVNPFLSHTLFAQGRQDRSMQVAAISLVINLISTWWLVSVWGVWGAAAGTVFGASVAFCCYALFALRRLELSELACTVAKLAVAATGLTMIMLFWRDNLWSLGIVLGGLVYLTLVVVLRIVTSTDVRSFRNAFQA